jgi:hypothetical protein
MTIEERRAKNAERMRAWRGRNSERANAIAAAGRRRNRAKIAASWKVYYKKNKAELYAKKKGYNARNSEKLRRWKHADYERHSESYKARINAGARRTKNAAPTKQSGTSETSRSFSRDSGIMRAAIEKRFWRRDVLTSRLPGVAQFGKHRIGVV